MPTKITITVRPKLRWSAGSQSLNQTWGVYMPILAKSVIVEVKRILELYKGETLRITVIDHSLWAALSLLVPNELSIAFDDRINSKSVKVLRIANSQNVIIQGRRRSWTRGCPSYLKLNADVTCCHNLEAHLHLMDGF
ncbi:hypothetical protein MLD38_019697 [Melastoma candidum]|uniref:Uncharacterized protein n=1 Tax=Melastoma candidum TaxID=119954 RepID=A0ACB9QYE0_9MYRT|nr:hypothetical protein MLD38_019697 [Melastoma candidum]